MHSEIFEVGDRVEFWYSGYRGGMKTDPHDGELGTIREISEYGMIYTDWDQGTWMKKNGFNNAGYDPDKFILVQPAVVITEPSDEIYKDLI